MERTGIEPVTPCLQSPFQSASTRLTCSNALHSTYYVL